MNRFRRGSHWILFHPEEKFRTNQHRSQRHLDTAFKSSVSPPITIELQRHFQIYIGYRPAVGTSHDGRQNLLGARVVLCAAYEDTLAARSITRALRVIGAVDRERVKCRLNPRMTVHV